LDTDRTTRATLFARGLACQRPVEWEV